MPIRTHRGRAAVWRRMFSWPMETPKHLAVSGAAAAVVLIAVGIAVGTGGGEDPPHRPMATSANTYRPTPPNTPSTTTSGPITWPSATPETPTPMLPVPAPPEALAAARGFAEQFVHHPAGMSNQQWVDGLRPYTDPETVGLLSSVDPANVDADAVTGEPVAVKASAAVIHVRVPVDTGMLEITLINQGSQWRVRDFDKGAP